uniref:G_PROTEIN_RECEP_F1_2 domain-containing protein n=1 Tax=Strongyloides venezuelensis TaxID=75913 RepID=A0A0K0EWJ0_STRVS
MSGIGMILSLLLLKPQETNQSYKTSYGIIFILSFISSLLLILISLFGKRVKYNSIKWHTLNYSFFNIIILLVRINNSNRSPWTNFMVKNLDNELQNKIFCICYGIYYFVGTFHLISVIVWYFSPVNEKKPFNKFVLWPTVIAIVDFMGILSFFLTNWLVDENEDPVYILAPISMYHGISLIVYGITMVVFSIFSFFLFITEIIQYYRYLSSQTIVEDHNQKKGLLKDYLSINILMVEIMSIISFIVIFPGNSVIFGLFIADNWGEYLIKYRETLTKLLKLTQKFGDIIMVIAPIVQFLMTIILVKEFRETFICIVTCGRFYSNDLNDNNKQWAKKINNKKIFVE